MVEQFLAVKLRLLSEPLTINMNLMQLANTALAYQMKLKVLL